MLLHLTLEGGEPTRRTGINMLGGLAGLLQVAAERVGLLLHVRPQHEDGLLVSVELTLGPAEELGQGSLSVLLEPLDRRLEAHNARGKTINTAVEVVPVRCVTRRRGGRFLRHWHPCRADACGRRPRGRRGDTRLARRARRRGRARLAALHSVTSSSLHPVISASSSFSLPSGVTTHGRHGLRKGEGAGVRLLGAMDYHHGSATMRRRC